MELDIEALYRRYGDMVLGRCRTLLRDDNDAQEACQEVFLKVYRYRDSFRGDASPSTWLYKTTTNTCLNMLRTRKRKPLQMLDDVSFVPDTVLDQVELRQTLGRLIETQDERTQQCIVYHFVDGMTHDEVGQLLGITGAAVRKRLAKFRSFAQEDNHEQASPMANGKDR